MDDGWLYIVLNAAQGGDGGGMTPGELREVSGLFLHAVFPLVSSQGINSVFQPRFHLEISLVLRILLSTVLVFIFLHILTSNCLDCWGK